MKARPVVSIRLIVAFGAVATTSAAVLAVGAIAERNSRLALTAEVEARLLLEARNLATTSSGVLLGEFPELVLHPLVRDLERQSPELAMVVVTDHKGRIQGHQESRLLGTAYEEPAGLVPRAPRHELLPGEAVLQNEDLLLVRVPVVTRNNVAIGKVEVGYHRAHVEDILAASRRKQLLVVAVVLGIAALASFLLMSWVLRPIRPLREGLARIGRGDLETPLALTDRTELGLLADAVDDMAAKLRAARDEMAEKQRLARELELAREIQSSLLPRTETVSGGFRIMGLQRAAAEVGGDYFDYFPLSGGRLGIAVADVSGKGLAGCMVMSMLSALLRAFKDSHRSPSDLLIRLDERLSERLMPGTFVTMAYGILDPGAGNLTVASAGHCPALLYRAATGGVERLGTRGIPLGAVRNGAIRKTLVDHTVRFEVGDLLLQYTDGINESFEPTGREQFGFERMEAAVAGAASRGAGAVLEALRGELDRWVAGGARQDDETLLVVSREVAAAAPVHPPETAREEIPVLDWVARARAGGRGLVLPARTEELHRIRAWTAAEPDLARLDASARSLLDTALYELAANIVEHGYGSDPAREIGLWWLPAAGLGTGSDRGGVFLFLDGGEPFRPAAWQASDFGDLEVRRRGRGFGLDIIHRTMSRVLYYPSTTEGNATFLVFDPDALDSGERSARYA